jgi:hypothetical protein
MNTQMMIIWALVLFGGAMIVIGVMEFVKKSRSASAHTEDPQVLQLGIQQSLVDATSGVIYVILGVMGITDKMDLQLVYGLVFVIAIVKKVIDTVIKSKIAGLDYDE